jgi:Mg-chelatase subunit ChlD
MTSDSTPVPSSDRHHAEIKGRNTALRVEARWQKPLIAAGGGEAMLLVRVLAAAVGEAEAGRAAPLDVAFVLDRSGSMQGDKLDLAKEGVDLAVARLRDADRAALIVYDDEVDTVQPLAPATPRLKASLLLALHGVDSGGSTYLSGGWIAGCHQLAEATPVSNTHASATRIRRVILLTDGLANVGILEPGVLARHASELRRRGIATTTVGVGQDFDEGLLSAMLKRAVATSSTLPARRGCAPSSPTSCRSCSVWRRPAWRSGLPSRQVWMPSSFPRSPSSRAGTHSRSPSATSPPATRSISSSPSARSAATPGRCCQSVSPPAGPTRERTHIGRSTPHWSHFDAQKERK